MITKDIRAGFSASTKSGRKTNGFIVFELRIRLRSGGKEAFEAIQKAYGEFIDHYSKEAVNNELGYWYNQLKTAADPIQRKRIEDKIEAMKAEKPISPRVILNEAPTEN